MPKVLNGKGLKAAQAYAKVFLQKYEEYLKKAAIKILVTGAGSKTGTAVGVKFTNRVNNSFGEARRGCKKAVVELHPHKDVYNEMGGSDAESDVPDALPAIKPVFPNEKFISGHVINAEFGGDGSDPANQTILTSGANSQHHFDDSVKAAWTMMTKAWEEMYRFASDTAAQSYMVNLQKDWAIKIVAVVDGASWYDTYKDDSLLKNDQAVKNKYPLDCVTTQVVFTATELKGPTEGDIGGNLRIDSSRMADLMRHISAFREHMSQATNFVVKQEPPASFTGRSPVSTEITDGKGDKKPFASNAWKKTLKVPVKKKPTGAPKVLKVTTKTVQSSFLTASGSVINLANGDNEIGAKTAGYPWASVATDLKGALIFYVWTDSAGGPALVSREDGVKTKIVVNGKNLAKSALPLDSGQTIRVYDDQAPNTAHSYVLTYQQK